MHLKVFVKLKKTLKTLSSGQKKTKKPKKTQKTQKKQKKPLGWFFFLKTRVFSNPDYVGTRCRLAWLTNSALLYEPKCGGRRGELRGLSQ